MPNVFIEARPKGQPEGSAIKYHGLEDRADRVLGTFNTRDDAIAWRVSEDMSRSLLGSAIATIKPSRITGVKRDPPPSKLGCRDDD